jgi:hypothetical protein
LVTASNTVLTRQGVTSSALKAGDVVKIVALPARNGSPLGFIKFLELGGKDVRLFLEGDQN